MGKAIDKLKYKIAVRKITADNSNYDIGLTIAEGEAILDELEDEYNRGITDGLNQAAKIVREI